MPKQSPFKKGRQLGPVSFRQFRKMRGRKQEELAGRIGTSKATVSRKERSREPYDQYYVEALSDELSVPPAALVMQEASGIDEFWPIWERANPGEKEQIVTVAKALVKARESKNEQDRARFHAPLSPALKPGAPVKKRG